MKLMRVGIALVVSAFMACFTQAEGVAATSLPKATVTQCAPLTLTKADHDYMVWPSGDNTVDRPLQIVMNFKAQETLEEAKAGAYGKYKCDFYLTIEGLAGDSITADNCYLAGNYGSFGWIVIPTDGTVLEEGVSYPIVSAYDANLTYENICDYVKDFTAAIYVAPTILAANPDFKVSLALKMTDPNNEANVLTIGTPATYTVKDLLPLPTATVTELNNEDLTFALNFKADSATEAQLATYGNWYADFVLKVNKDVTFNANGGANGYLSGQYDAWSENWVNVPFEDVTLEANESLKIMAYAAEMMNQGGLKLTYNDVVSFVKDFDCGVFFEPAFLAANPDLNVTLELRMYNPANEDESYVIGKTYEFKVGEKPTVVIPETITPPEGIEGNTAVETTVVVLPTEVKTFEISLKTVEMENAVTTKVVFTVEPKNEAGDKVATPASAITFRLPVPTTWAGMVKVFHDGTLMGTYAIQESEGAKFVELSSDSFSEFALEQVVPVEVATYDALVTALAAGDSVKLTADITLDTKITCPDGVSIDLNGKTLNVNVENSTFGNATIKNGNIVLGKDDVHVCDGYFIVNAGKTLVLDGVTMNSAAEGIKGYAVFHLKTGANLDLNNSTLNISNNEYAAGYIVYAGEATATVDVVNTTITGSKVNGIVHAATKIENSSFTITDATEHGINRSGVTITDSTVTISGGAGRGITAQHGALVINGNSKVTITDMGEASIELRGNQNLTIDTSATVTVDKAVNNTTTGTVTGTVTVNPLYGKVAKIGDTPYATLEAAFAAVKDGETITLLQDVTYTKTSGFVNGDYVDGLVYTGDKSFTVDFDSHTITENGEINDYLVYLKNTGEKDNEITFKNGTISVKADSAVTAWAAITVGASSATHKTTLNLVGMTVVNGNPNSTNNQVIRIRNGSVVNLNEGTWVKSNGTSYGVIAQTGSTVNINNGAKIVQSNSGTTGGNNVYTAVSGNGVINVYDGAVIESDKYGIHNTTSGNAVINIYGGTITAPVAVHAATNGGTGESAEVNIFGGTFKGELETYTDVAQIKITGGTFSIDVSGFCADGYTVEQNADGTYGVVKETPAVVLNASTVAGTIKFEPVTGDKISYVLGRLEVSSTLFPLAGGIKIVEIDVNRDIVETENVTVKYNTVIKGDGSVTGTIVVADGGALSIANTVNVDNLTVVDSNGNVLVKNDDGSYTDPPAVAKIGDTPYATLSAAFAAVTADNQTVTILKDVTEELTGAYPRGNITTENDAKVTITLTNSDWVYCPYTFVLGANVTLKCPALFYYAGGTQINGTLIVDAYYQRYAGTKLTINEPGSMTVTSETFILRYTDGDANAGIYINGDNNDETIGLKLAVAYFYQGMISAKDANLQVGTYWQTNDTDNQGSANLVLDNSSLNVTVNDHNMKATGNSTVTLKNGSSVEVAGGYQGAAVKMDATSSFTKNGNPVFVAKIGETLYATLQATIDAAQDDDVITFLCDVTQADGVVITDKKLKIDLNGKTFTVSNGANTNNRNFKIDGASEVVILNGTMVAAGDYSSGAYGTVRTEGTAKVELQNLKLYNYRGNGLNVKVLGGTTVTMTDVEIYSQYGGGVESAGGTVELTDVVVQQKGMYTAPYNSMAISVNGGGKVTVQSGTYSTECLTAEEANNQGTSHGPWVAGVLNSGGTLIINGGTFSNDNFGENNLATYARGAILADTGANIQINGGTFNALKAIVDIQNNLGDASKNPTGEIKGGIFSADPSNDYVKVAEGYIVTENNGTYTVAKPAVAQIGETTYATLADAVAAANSGDTIVLKAGEYELPLFANKELTFKGESKEGVIINDAPDANTQGWLGSTFHFENLTAKGATANYHGLANGVVAVTYKDCIIKGLRFLYANEVSFETCEFKAEGVEHSFWTYGAPKVTVSNCSFSYTDRAVNCYSENGAEHELDIAFTDCTFTYEGTADAPEGAVEINSGSVKSIELAMDNCTAPQKGAMWYNSQWDSKKGQNTVVIVDDVAVWPLVAEVNGVKYADLQAALEAAVDGDTIKLLADVTCTEKPVFSKGGVVNVDVNGHVLVSTEQARVRNVVSADGVVPSNNIKFVSGFGWEVYSPNTTEGVNFRVFPTLDAVIAYEPAKPNPARIYPYENVKQDKDVVLRKYGHGTSSTICIDPEYDITWDLNGYTVLQESPTGNPLEACIRGKFTLKDSSAEQSGKWIAGACGVTNPANSWYGNGGPALYVLGEGEAILEGGTISIARNATSDTAGNEIVNSGGLIRVDGGKLDVNGATLQVDDTYGVMAWGGEIEINAGTFDIDPTVSVPVYAVGYYEDVAVEVNSTFDGALCVYGNVAGYKGASAMVNVAGVEYATGSGWVVPSVGEGLMTFNGLVLEEGVAVVTNATSVTPYATLADALNAAQAGDTIELLADVTATDVILIGKSININGNGHKVTSSATRVFRITTGNIEVAFDDVDIVSTAVRSANVDSIRGISIDGGFTGIKLTLDDCSVDFTDASASDCSYAVNVTGGSGHTLTVNGGTYEGANVINVWGTDHAIAITGATLTSIYGYNASYYGCIVRVEAQIAALTLKNNTFNGEHAVVMSYDEGTTITTLIDENNIDNTRVMLGGSGTEVDPYLIKSLAGLKSFRDSVNAGETKYNAPGVYVALAADIDLAGVNWVGIGSINQPHGFMGNFDGKTFKIKNLTITNPALDSDGYAYAGLFSITEGTDQNNQNTIKNLTIENVTIDTTGHIVSAAIAYPYYTIVENVKVCGNINIKGGDYTAGALAYTRRCVNASDISVIGNDATTSIIVGGQTVGGVISDIQTNGGLIANYSNFKAENLTITGTKQVGGIAGIISQQTLNGATVKNVTIVCSDARVGQVVGSLGGTSTVSDIVVEDVTGATVVIGGAYDGGAAVQAKIGDTYYTTFERAAAAATEGQEVTLLVPPTADEGVEITAGQLTGVAAYDAATLLGGTFKKTAEGTLHYEYAFGVSNVIYKGGDDFTLTIAIEDADSTEDRTLTGRTLLIDMKVDGAVVDTFTVPNPVFVAVNDQVTCDVDVELSTLTLGNGEGKATYFEVKVSDAAVVAP